MTYFVDRVIPIALGIVTGQGIALLIRLAYRRVVRFNYARGVRRAWGEAASGNPSEEVSRTMNKK